MNIFIKNPNIFRKVKNWILTAVALTLVCGLMYVVAQQSARSEANDPQIGIAEDTAILLESGMSPDFLVSGVEKTDIGRSLSPYVIIFDDMGEVVGSSAELSGAVPRPPVGVFDYAREHGENRLTWEPQPNVRSAIVVKHYSRGFVLAGRSLREIEGRSIVLLKEIAAGWVFSLILTFAVAVFI